MMIVDAVFQISICKKNNGCKLLDGRLLRDISLTDELIILENVDTSYYNQNCDKDDRLIINGDVPYEVVQINKIFSYGEYWESLPSGMSARLECNCDREDLTDLLLCKILER